MKYALGFIVLALQFSVNAQDTIYKRAGDVIPAKILEIGIKDVSYKRMDLVDGPLFIINKNEIRKIKYAIGTIDSFNVVNEEPKRPSVVFVNPTYLIQNNSEIQHAIRRGTYRYQGRQFSDKNVFFMANEKNQVWKNTEIDFNIRESKKNKGLQYAIGYGGAVVGGLGLYGSVIAASYSSNGNDGAAAAFVGILSAGVAVSSQIVSFKYKLKRVKHADKVVELYNQLSKI